MKKIDLQQGTPQWLAWRQDGLGGSDAPAIMGVSPWSSPEQLFREKTTRERREATYAMRRGIRLEPEARYQFEQKTGLVVHPACCEHEELPWLRASLDGIDFWDTIIVEIKCPKITDHELAIAGSIPDYYYPQLQHQLMVTGCERCLYVSYSLAEQFADEDRLAIVEVAADEEYIRKLLREERLFWRRCEAALAVMVEA